MMRYFLDCFVVLLRKTPRNDTKASSHCHCEEFAKQATRQSKKILFCCILGLFLISFVTSAYQKPDVYVIDAERNAVSHNNKGLEAMDDENYFEAVQEFSLAILLNPKTQATATYYNNLGLAYMKLGCYKDAQGCFEKAIKQYSLNFLYYQNLVQSFKSQKILKQKTAEYEKKSEKNSLSMIILGLIYVENGDVRRGIIKLDEFCMKEPSLLITPAVRSYIESVVSQD